MKRSARHDVRQRVRQTDDLLRYLLSTRLSLSLTHSSSLLSHRVNKAKLENVKRSFGFAGYRQEAEKRENEYHPLSASGL